jgi:hypothetical protein
MRKLITLVFFVFTLTSNFAQIGWQEVTTLPNVANINSIAVVDANILWVCCDGGSVFR